MSVITANRLAELQRHPELITRDEVLTLLDDHKAADQRITALAAENEYARWRFKESDLLFGQLIITMRCAVIEQEHGEGDKAAMDWIINKLAGPGEFAPDSETDAQAYFNRESEIIDAEFSKCMAYFESLRKASLSKTTQI